MDARHKNELPILGCDLFLAIVSDLYWSCQAANREHNEDALHAITFYHRDQSFWR
jgi:hypothetical protein